MHIITAQTLDLVLISKIRSFEKSIKFLAYILISCKMRIIWKSAPALLHSSNSKFQTCNWAVTEEQISPPAVNFDQTKCIQIGERYSVFRFWHWDITNPNKAIEFNVKTSCCSGQLWVFANPQAATRTRLNSLGSFEEAASFISGNTSSRISGNQI